MSNVSIESKRRDLDEKTDSNPGLVHTLIYELIKNFVKGKRVLDIGSWTGQIAWLAKDDAKEILGIDPGERAVKFANKKFKKYKNIKFKKSTAEDLSLDEKFETAIMIEVIEHLPVGFESEVIKKVNKALIMDGNFIITTQNKNIFSILMDPAYFLIGHRHYSDSELTHLLEKNGFQVKKVKYIGGFAHLITSNIQMIFKHIFKTRFNTPRWLEKMIEKEFLNKGFSGIIVYSKKVKNL